MLNQKPVIAISCTTNGAGLADSPARMVHNPMSYSNAIAAAGGVPVLCPECCVGEYHIGGHPFLFGYVQAQGFQLCQQAPVCRGHWRRGGGCCFFALFHPHHHLCALAHQPFTPGRHIDGGIPVSSLVYITPEYEVS